MRLSLKAKLTALITLLVLLVVVVTSTVYISDLTRQALLEVQSKGEYVANEVSHQAATALVGSHMPGGENPQDLQALRTFVQTCLSSDPGLKSLMESAVGYLPVVDYVAITDTNLVVLVHSNPDEVGQPSYSRRRAIPTRASAGCCGNFAPSSAPRALRSHLAASHRPQAAGGRAGGRLHGTAAR